MLDVIVPRHKGRCVDQRQHSPGKRILFAGAGG